MTRAPSPNGQLDDEAADPAGAAVHEEGVARSDVGRLERVLGGAADEGDRRRLLEREPGGLDDEALGGDEHVSARRPVRAPAAR